MLEKLKKLFRNKEALLDAMGLITGVTMFVAILLYGVSRSKTSMYLVILMGGLLNLINGRKLYRQKAKRNIGLSMMMLGAIILILCLTVMIHS